VKGDSSHLTHPSFTAERAKRWAEATSGEARGRVLDFTQRLVSGDPFLLEELDVASRIVLSETVRNSMIATLRRLEIWPPPSEWHDVDEFDCSYEDTHSSLPVIAQRIYNDEQRRQSESGLLGARMARRAITASFLVDFASESGIAQQEMPQTHAWMLQEFQDRVQEWEDLQSSENSRSSSSRSCSEGDDNNLEAPRGLRAAFSIGRRLISQATGEGSPNEPVEDPKTPQVQQQSTISMAKPRLLQAVSTFLPKRGDSRTESRPVSQELCPDGEAFCPSGHTLVRCNVPPPPPLNTAVGGLTTGGSSSSSSPPNRRCRICHDPFAETAEMMACPECDIFICLSCSTEAGCYCLVVEPISVVELGEPEFRVVDPITAIQRRWSWRTRCGSNDGDQPILSPLTALATPAPPSLELRPYIEGELAPAGLIRATAPRPGGETASKPCATIGGAANFVGEVLRFPYHAETNLFLRLRDERKIQAWMRGDPLIGSATLALGPELLDCESREVILPLARGEAPAGILTLSFRLQYTNVYEKRWPAQ